MDYDHAFMSEIMEDEDPVMDVIDDYASGGVSCARGFVHINPIRRNIMKERYVEPKYPRLPSEGNLEWQYTMRRTMQEIIPGLFLGPYASATRAKLEDMQAAGLTHVVCVRQNLERNLIRPNHPDNFKYLVVEIADTATENIIPHFKMVNAFLEECLAGGGRALVHGNAGISRSAALVIAFIMSKYGVTLKESFSFVQSKRFCCNPNEGFMAQLREYEPIYRALHTVPLPLPGDNSGITRSSMKRGLDMEDTDPSAAYSTVSVMDTSMPPQQPQQVLCSSSESSVSSSAESLPHVLTNNHPATLPAPPPAADPAMSMS